VAGGAPARIRQRLAAASKSKEEPRMALDPGGLLGWLVAGLIAGFLAGQVMKGGGYGVVGDIVLGIVGAFIGGFLATALGWGGTMGLLGTILVAFIGAVVLIAIVRAVAPGRTSL
jgi:uncharacterized membrane protein YeaQ/YmgE (transglycosylase-associated protein family)